MTAWFDARDLAPFDALRRHFFPRTRNYLGAHLTLFHQLPGIQRVRILADLHAALDGFVLPDGDGDDGGGAQVRTRGVLPLGRGVAYALEPAPLADLRAACRARLVDLLAPQDARPWGRPHITVQNKVAPAEARRLARHLAARYRPCSLRLYGVQVWRYDGGPWTAVEEIPFARHAGN